MTTKMNAELRKKRFGVGDRLNILKCNHCKEFVLHEHRAAHALECRAKRNRAKLSAMNLEKNGQQMYAVAVTRLRKNKTWTPPEIEHVHADGPQHAKAQVLAGEAKATTHIIEAGLAIGWFEDEKGLITG